MSQRKLKEGDIIKIEAGHTVIVTIPERFVYSNTPASWKLTKQTVTIGQNYMGLDTSIYAGKYVVTKTYTEHFSEWSQDRVICKGILGTRTNGDEIEFCQNGHSNAVIENISPIGTAEIEYKIN